MQSIQYRKSIVVQGNTFKFSNEDLIKIEERWDLVFLQYYDINKILQVHIEGGGFVWKIKFPQEILKYSYGDIFYSLELKTIFTF